MRVHQNQLNAAGTLTHETAEKQIKYILRHTQKLYLGLVDVTPLGALKSSSACLSPSLTHICKQIFIQAIINIQFYTDFHTRVRNFVAARLLTSVQLCRLNL